MTKTSMIFVSLLCSLGSGSASSWSRFYGDYLGDICKYAEQTKDGGYILVGGRVDYPEGLSWDLCLMKLDSTGDTIWSKIYGRHELLYDEIGNCVRETSDSGYIIASSFPNDETQSYDIWLLKTDRDGDTLWTLLYDYEGGEDEAYFVEETSDGGYILVGWVSDSIKDAELFLLKTTANGSILWTKTYGGKESEGGSCVRETSDGCYIITGSTTSYSDELSPYDLWLLKVSANGDEIWTKRYRSTISSAASLGKSVEQTTDGGYIVVGENNYNIWLLKTDAFGDTTWTRTFDDAWQGIDEAGQVHQTQDGGFIIVGTSLPLYLSWQVWLIKTDNQGNTMWSREYGCTDADNAASVDLTSDGGYFIGGSTGSYGLNTGIYDFWAIKTDSTGRVRMEVSPVMITEPYLLGPDNLDSIIPGACFSVLSTDPYQHEYLSFCEIRDLATNKICYLDSVLTNDELHEPWQYDTVKFKQWTASGYSDYEISFYARGTRGDTFFSRPMSWRFHWSGVEEQSYTKPSFNILSPVGRSIVLNYSNYPNGFRADIFDSSGRKVDELRSQGASGTITWGNGVSTGVYFIKTNYPNSKPTKVVLLL